MSSSIWTRCAGDSELKPLRLSPWRIVEAQHQVSTRKLVDTLAEQAILEDLIEVSKPPDPTPRRLHYLLATPFRYPPLRHGSRFGKRHEAQALGRAMRDAGVDLFRYPSARDAERGVNVGVFSPAAFGAAKPRALEAWHCTATRDRVELLKRDYFKPSTLTFMRETFLVDGVLPTPAP